MKISMSQFVAIYFMILSATLMSHIQGPPLGTDIKYLVLADRNMQVGFSFKVVWES